MNTVIFETEDAVFKFDRKTVMECLENMKSSYNVQEIDTLIDVLSNQPEQTSLSSAEHPYFGFIALDLIRTSEGSVECKNCQKHYRFYKLQAYTVGPDDATFKAATSKKGGLKSLFRKKPKLPGLHGAKLYRCPHDHILIYMQTWTT